MYVYIYLFIYKKKDFISRQVAVYITPGVCVFKNKTKE